MSAVESKSSAGMRETLAECAFGLFIQLVVTANDAGKLSVTTPSQAADTMLSAIEGIKLRAVFEPEISEQDDIEGFVETLLKIVSVSNVNLSI